MSIHRHLLSSAAIALLLAAPAVAQQMPAPNRASAPPRELSQHDMEFVNKAAIGGMTEVELGKLAERNGGSAQVKQFGARMVKDHSAANSELATIARGKGVQLPQQLDAEHQQTRDRLAQLHGADFDRAYMQDMVKDHDQDMNEFRQEAQAAQDPDIKRFAQQTLSVIQ